MQSQGMTANSVVGLLSPLLHAQDDRSTPSACSLQASSNSQLKKPTHPHLVLPQRYSTEPGHSRAVPVSREWDNLVGGGRGYGRPRPVAVGGGSLLWGRNNPNYTSTLTQAT